MLFVVIGSRGLAGCDGSNQFHQILTARVAGLVAGKRFDAKTLHAFDAVLNIEVRNGLQARNLREAVLVDDALHAVRQLAADTEILANRKAAKVSEFQSFSLSKLPW